MQENYAVPEGTNFNKDGSACGPKKLSLTSDSNCLYATTRALQSSDQNDVVLLLVVQGFHLQEDRLADEVR